MSTSTSPAIGSMRSGVRVRRCGRDPSAWRNSLPFHSGSTSSPWWGSSSRTLAAGWAGSRPDELRSRQGHALQPRRAGRGGHDLGPPEAAAAGGGRGSRRLAAGRPRPQSGGAHARLTAMADLNVLGGELEPCGTDPMTGFYRDGCCSTGPEDLGSHTICAVVTAEFLEHQRSIGNDLSTPVPQYRFPGLVPGRPLVRHRGQLAAGPRGRVRGAGGAGLHPPPRPRHRAARGAAGPRRRRARATSARSTSEPGRVTEAAPRTPPAGVREAASWSTTRSQGQGAT